MIKTGDMIYYNKHNFKGAVIEELFKIYSEKTNIKFTNNKSKATKIVLDDTIDSEANEIVNDLINKKVKAIMPIDGKIIRPLYLFLDEEILLYARLKRLKFKIKKKKINNISEFLDNMEKKHPEVKRAVVNGYMKTLQ